jgi:hypothetical protein
MPLAHGLEHKERSFDHSARPTSQHRAGAFRFWTLASRPVFPCEAQLPDMFQLPAQDAHRPFPTEVCLRSGLKKRLSDIPPRACGSPQTPRNRPRFTAYRGREVVHDGGHKIRRPSRKSDISRGFCIGVPNPSLSAKNSRNLRTCAGMRRRQKSYSLGNLCDIYQIDLKEHHRALCDAKAAAQLLNLVNQKREAARPAVLEHAASLAARVW